MKKEEAENKLNWNLLNEKMENMNLDDQEKEKIKREILHKEAEQMRMKYFFLIFLLLKTNCFYLIFFQT